MKFETGYDTGIGVFCRCHTDDMQEWGVCVWQAPDGKGCAYTGTRGPYDGACPHLDNPNVTCYIKNCAVKTLETVEKRRIAEENENGGNTR